MTNEVVSRTGHNAIQLAGRAANHAAAQYIFEDYRARRSANTLRRQQADLDLFRQYLTAVNALPALDFARTPDAWRGMTWGLIAGFVQWQMQQGYAVASINVRLSTVKKYAALAFQAGAIDTTEHALIRTVTGYTFKESKQVDEKRSVQGVNTRKGAKKAEAVPIHHDAAKNLKSGHPDTPQGRRDALLMCLLLDHGLRCGEVALLKAGNFNLTDGTFTFHRPKVDKVQTHNLTPDTRRALKAWIDFGDCPLAAEAPILRGSTKGGALTLGGMTERAITKRVAELGKRHGLIGLSAHDCRHYWATRASRKGTDPFALQEAGGWNSLAMPRRYVEAARIANEGVKLD
jgi:integrase